VNYDTSLVVTIAVTCHLWAPSIDDHFFACACHLWAPSVGDHFFACGAISRPPHLRPS